MRFLLLALLCFGLSASAQTSQILGFEIKGSITDSVSGKGLDYITVGLKTDKNIGVKSGLTVGDGKFTFSGIKPGKYLLVIVAVGYKQKILPIDLTENKDLGSIPITASNTSLKEVIVSADRPLIKQDIDKISYDLQADPESKVNSVLEMMRKVPLLSLDAEDNIQLKGSGNYKILINGKPSGMVDKNPKDILRSMPASSIQNIEVITNPPSKYDSEGLAGIINIITNKKIDNGYNGSINFNQRFPVGGPGIGGSFNFKQGKFGASGYGGFNSYSSPATDSYNTRLTTGNAPTDLTQNSSRGFESNNGYMGTELSFEIDSLNLISGQFGLNGGRYTNNSLAKSILKGPLGVIQTYDLLNVGKSLRDGYDAALNYQLGFRKDKNRLLTFSYRFYTYGEGQGNNLTASNKFKYDLPDYQQTNDGFSSEQTVQVDYIHPLKKFTIEGGIKGIIRANESDFQYNNLNPVTGEYVPDLSRTNQFNNDQSIWGAYNSYQYNLKNWGFKAGLRLEETVVDADFVSTGSQIEQNYFNLIPSVSVNRKFKNMSSLSFGYTQRIQRPGIWNLNPFVDRSNPNFESTGNPNLRPVLSNNFQVNYSRFKKGSINIGMSYAFSNNTMQRIAVFDPATNITRSTFENIGKDKSIGSNFNVNYPITKKWNFNLSGNLNYVFIEGMVNGTLTKNDGMRGYFFGSSGYRFEKGLRVNANMHYSTPYIMLQGKGNSNVYFGLSANKDIIKDKLSFSASTNNPFNKFRNFTNQTAGGNFSQFSSSTSYFRSFGVSMNYRFGKLKEAIKKNKRGINNDDVSGGSSGGTQ